MNVTKIAIWSFISGMLGSLVLLVSLVDVPLAQRFEAIHADLGKYSWIFDQISSDVSVDIAIVGSSHSLNGVDDRQLTELTGWLSLNLAVSYMGRDMQYFFVRELLRTGTIRRLLIEADASETRQGHEYFGMVADGSDILKGMFLPDINLLRNVDQYLSRKANLVFEPIRGPVGAGGPVWNHGWGFLPQENQYDREELLRRRNSLPTLDDRRLLAERFKDIEFSYSLHYIREICQLATEKGVQVTFFYLPYYKAPNVPEFYDAYRECGDVLTPPTSLVNDPGIWSNVSHLNPKGAQEYTRWLAQALIEQPRSKDDQSTE